MTHENTYDSTPVIGYGDGLVTGPGTPVRIDNNDWILIGDFKFNVHPHRSDLGGYPVRWIETTDGSAVRPITASEALKPKTSFAPYAWHIDRSFIEDSNFGSPCEVSITGPGNPALDPSLEQQLIDGHGENFKMHDDDGNLYYTGRIVGDFDGLEPLDDFGMPNAGCTHIDINGERV